MSLNGVKFCAIMRKNRNRYFFSHPGMFNMTFPCTTTLGAIDPARCFYYQQELNSNKKTSKINCDGHCNHPDAIIIEIQALFLPFPT